MMGVSVEVRVRARWERWEKIEGEVGASQGVMASIGRKRKRGVLRSGFGDQRGKINENDDDDAPESQNETKRNEPKAP